MVKFYIVILLLLTFSCSKEKEFQADESKFNKEVSSLVKLGLVPKDFKTRGIGMKFNDYGSFSSFVWSLKSTGHGVGAGPQIISNTKEFISESIEIPKKNKQRIIVAEKQKDGTIIIVDDFIINQDTMIFEVVHDQDEIVYSSQNKKSFRTTKLQSKTFQ